MGTDDSPVFEAFEIQFFLLCFQPRTILTVMPYHYNNTIIKLCLEFKQGISGTLRSNSNKITTKPPRSGILSFTKGPEAGPRSGLWARGPGPTRPILGIYESFRES